MGMFAETATVDTIYNLLIKENKLPFSVSICRKQTEVCRFHFLFAANKRKLPFSVSSFIHLRNSGNMETGETWKHGDLDIEAWKHGQMET
jgi:hypothetical protein